MANFECPYYLRNKRRKIEEKFNDIKNGFYEAIFCRKRKNPFMHLPTEILEKILRNFTYEELSQTLRLVNKRFKILAENILNEYFVKIEDTLAKFKNIDFDQIPIHVEADKKLNCYLRVLNVSEYLMFQHRILKASVWRYLNRNFCMYAGRLLDLYKEVIDTFNMILKFEEKTFPRKEHQLSQISLKISKMTKRFCHFFEKNNEEPINVSPISAGTKFIDILDCDLYCFKEIQKEKVINRTYHGKFVYYLKNSWFVAFHVKEEKPMTWNQQQRFMYMRLRRLVLAHTEMQLIQEQYKREISLTQHNSNIISRNPSNSIYTGYGQIGNTFYFYGSMNDGAYMNKFPIQNDHDTDEFDEDESYESLFSIPYLGVEMNIEIKCPVNLAPLTFLKAKQRNNRVVLVATRKKKSRSLFHLLLDVECKGAHYSRLPTKFTYSIHEMV